MNVKNLVRPWLHSLEPYPPGKPLDELEREYGVTDSIKLASNENPLGPSPKALRALEAALADGKPVMGNPCSGIPGCGPTPWKSGRIIWRQCRKCNGCDKMKIVERRPPMPLDSEE